MSRASDIPAPMPMAEFDDCCGQYRWGTAIEDRVSGQENFCDNCPVLLERIERRRERVLQAARAL